MLNNSNNRTATLLGLAGLLPFAASAVLIWSPTFRELATASLEIYSAVILSFIGAVHWGVALSHKEEAERDRRLVFSVLPALAAWVLLLLPPLFSLPLLMTAFILVWAVERLVFSKLLPSWYLLLRAGLTIGVVLFLAVGMMARY